jgi:hypothetical protein
LRGAIDAAGGPCDECGGDGVRRFIIAMWPQESNTTESAAPAASPRARSGYNVLSPAGDQRRLRMPRSKSVTSGRDNGA